MKTTKIYILIDPRNQQVRYVGKSDNGEKRYPESWKLPLKEGRYKRNWVSSLLKEGLKPEFEIIDEVLESEWRFWEIHYISLYKSWGFDLTNLTPGGDGIEKGHKMPPRTPEHNAKVKATKMRNGTWAQSHNAEVRRKIGVNSRKKVVSEEEKIKRRNSINSWSEERKELYTQRLNNRDYTASRKENKKRKGKTIEEIYGKDRALELRIKQREGSLATGKFLKSQKPVGKYTLEDVLVKTYKSVSEAGNDCPKFSAGAVSSCCKGKKKTVYGHIYKYL